MCKSSFTVSYLSPSNPEICILGVISIVPNLNGLLLFTEDGEGFQIESYEMATCEKCSPFARLYIEYSSEEDIKEAMEDPEISVFDHRKK